MSRRFNSRAIRLALRAAVAAAFVSVPALAQDGPPTGRVVYVEPAGKLKVKQRRSDGAATATVGTIVRRGYLLNLDPGAKAAVRCDDGKLHQLGPGLQGSPCVAPVAGAIYDGYGPPRTGGADTRNKAFPVIISPRGTRLLTTRPTIRWSPVVAPPQGAPVKYQVIVFREKMEKVWQREVSGLTELEYPAAEPPLARGVLYKVIVEAGERSSEAEGTPDMGVTVLTDEQANHLAAAETQLRGLNLPAAETQFLVAELFAARGLTSEAIDKLNALRSTLNQPWVLLLLGDLYAAVGLHREAVTQYEGVLVLSQTAEDPEAQALAFASAGSSYLALGAFADANSVFTKAVDAYRKLGITVDVKQLKKGAVK